MSVFENAANAQSASGSRDEEYLLTEGEAQLATTVLALMTGFSQGCCAAHRAPMAQRVSTQLARMAEGLDGCERSEDMRHFRKAGAALGHGGRCWHSLNKSPKPRLRLPALTTNFPTHNHIGITARRPCNERHHIPGNPDRDCGADPGAIRAKAASKACAPRDAAEALQLSEGAVIAAHGGEHERTLSVAGPR